MSSSLIDDNKAFQQKYGFDQDEMTMDKLRFRMSLLSEEFDEANVAMVVQDAEELVDAHIDLIVIALGNLYLMGVDIEKAWKEVFKANMSKKRGVKKGREASGGFDVYKPEGWIPPNHSDNHGVLDELFS